MFYHIFKYLGEYYDIPGSGMFQYISFRAAAAIILALLIVIIFGRKIIDFLRRKQIGEDIRDLGLEGQLQKRGTPTMGGVIILLAILVPILLFGRLDNIYIQLMIVSTVWLGLIGGLDDYIKVFRHNKEGLKGRFKIVGQVGLGIIVGTTMWLSPQIIVREKVTQPVQTVYLNPDGSVIESVQRNVVLSSESTKTTKTTIPFVKNNEFDYGWLTGEDSATTWLLYVLVAIFVVTAVSNGANLTDGLDGLATGVSVPIVAVLGVLAYLSGHIVYADYLNIMYIPRQRRAGRLRGGLRGRAGRLPVVQLLPGADLHGGHRLPVDRRHHRRLRPLHPQGTAAAAAVRRVPGREFLGDDAGRLLQIHQTQIRRRAAPVADGPRTPSFPEKRAVRNQDRAPLLDHLAAAGRHHPGNVKDPVIMKKIAVLGGGISGYGSAILAKKKEFDVFLSDMGKIADRYKAKLDEWQVPYEEGGHTEERILAAHEVVKSPGIPETAPIVRKIRAAGIPVISEMEFAGRYLGRSKCICITGSNGKTTTTSLIYKIMRDAGLNAALGGNIGESFAYSVATGDYDWYVLELSSFQLDGMYKFRAHIGVLMNITPDHLDRYGHCFQNYVDSKMRITQNQNSRDYFVYSGDDEVIWQQLPRYDLRMKQLPFAAKNAVASGAGDAFLCDGKFTAAVGKASVEIDTAKMQLKGLHNAYNAMAAALATLAAGVAPASIRRSIYGFAPVCHRLEPVREANGVLWINDSKATNVDSVYYALESMTRPVVWIAGGTDKGNDYEPLKAFARAKVHTLVCMGADNTKLIEEFTGVVPEVVSTGSLDAAMEAAKAAAQPGDAVLLSPACASFDLFKNYENRGELFKAWVNEKA